MNNLQNQLAQFKEQRLNELIKQQIELSRLIDNSPDNKKNLTSWLAQVNEEHEKQKRLEQVSLEEFTALQTQFVEKVSDTEKQGISIPDIELLTLVPKSDWDADEIQTACETLPKRNRPFGTRGQWKALKNSEETNQSAGQ